MLRSFSCRCSFSKCPAQCSGGRYPPRRPCRRPPKVSQTSIHRAYLFPGIPLWSFPNCLIFPALYARHIIWALQYVSEFLSTCSRTSLKGDSCCHRPCIPSCFSLAASANTFLAHALLIVKYFHSAHKLFTSEIFHNLPR